MKTNTNNNSKLDSAIVLMFFLSGFSALIYQVLWVRLLTKYVGGSAFSISIVLTVFMGGLALGSAIAARFVDRIKEADGLILLYGLIEALVALCGILIPVCIPLLEPLYSLLYDSLYQRFLIYNVLASLLSVVMLLIPTSLMGATLPVLSKYYLRTFPDMGTRIGKLYGINTLAAALGALLSGTWMIYSFGVYQTIGIAVVINIGIALACIAIVRRNIKLPRPFALARRPAIPAAKKHFHATGVLFILAVSGFCAMGYEVTWTRLLTLLVGPTTYSLSIVLFTFITGLALGSMLFGKICDKVKRPLALLVATQLCACGLALATSQLLGSSQIFFAKLLYELRGNFFLLEAVKSIVLFGFMLPATLLFGAAFPIATKAHTMRLQTVGSSVGHLYVANTVGALLGSFLTGFVLIPFIGKTLTVSFLVAAQAATAFTVIAVYFVVSRKSKFTLPPGLLIDGRRLLPAVAVSAAILLLCGRFPRWDASSLAQAKYHRFQRMVPALTSINFSTALFQPERHEEILPPDNKEILYLNDGIGGFVAVGRTINELGATNIFLSISGKTDASTRHDMSTMALSGQVPMLFHPDAEKALVVGLASGITAGEMLRYPVKRVDVLEISPEVVEAADYFTPWNNNVLTDPRARIITQDARTHLALSDEKYDVIMSEPSNPWMAGVASLFTKEYFLDVKKHLESGGIFVQWFQTYQTDWRTFSMMAGTLDEVFPNKVLMRSDTQGADFLFVCFENDTGHLSLDVARDRMKYARKSTNMRMANPSLLFPLILTSSTRQLFETYVPHTENHPYLEQMAPRGLYSGGENIASRVSARGTLSPEIQAGLRDFSDTKVRIDFADFMASMNVFPFNLVNAPGIEGPLPDRLNNIYRRYSAQNVVTDYDRIVDTRSRNLCLSVQQGILESRRKHLRTRSAQSHVIARISFALGDVHRAYGDYNKAAQLYSEALKYMPQFRLALKNLAASYERLGQFGRATRVVDRLLSQTPSSHSLLTRKAANQLKTGDREAALKNLEKALSNRPDYVPALVAASGIHGMLENYQISVDYGYRALEHDPTSLRAYRNLIVALARLNRRDQIAHVAQQGLEHFPQNDFLRQAFDQTKAYMNDSK